ncbi:hypothetical protein [Hyphomicrobium sp. 99]|uniref:hypothetical protein n=1 Tax=Hyphomicrobium sp. 99 TaxID=1163419 RepID=UPI0005F77599|nr:hypothetical protein [Hyphomicrobium sp. 99]
MSKFYAALVAGLLLATGAYAADQKIAAPDIKKNLEAAASDPAKVTAYCAMSKKMDEIGDDEKKAEAAGDQIDGYFKVLGDDFENAWDAGQDAADGSPEATAMDQAVATLDAKCK